MFLANEFLLQLLLSSRQLSISQSNKVHNEESAKEARLSRLQDQEFRKELLAILKKENYINGGSKMHTIAKEADKAIKSMIENKKINNIANLKAIKDYAVKYDNPEIMLLPIVSLLSNNVSAIQLRFAKEMIDKLEKQEFEGREKIDPWIKTIKEEIDKYKQSLKF